MDDRLNLRKTFNTPFEDNAERNGQPFVLVRTIDTTNGTINPEVLPLFVYVIRFEDGVEIEVWPEEIEADQPEFGIADVHSIIEVRDFAQRLEDDLAAPCPGGCGESSYFCACLTPELAVHGYDDDDAAADDDDEEEALVEPPDMSGSPGHRDR